MEIRSSAPPPRAGLRQCALGTSVWRRRTRWRAGVSDFCNQLFHDGLTERIEVLRLDDERAGPAGDVVAVVLGEAAGRIGVFGIPRQRTFAQDYETVDGDAEPER